MKRFKSLIFTIGFFIPFLLGFYGFISEGEGILDSAYYSFTLYTVNPVSDKMNVFIELARWLSPAVMASSIFIFIKTLSQKISDYFICKKRDSFALYGDSKDIDTFKECLPSSVAVKDGKVKKAAHHIIMFEKDEDSFRFFKSNHNSFSGKDVYIRTDSIEMFRSNNSTINILNLKETVATDYWKKHSLINFFNKGNEEVNIVFLSFDTVSKTLLDYAILNNIYTPEQKINYHIFGDSTLYKNIHSDLNLMNKDEILYHEEAFEENTRLISTADRIIITSPISSEALFMLSEKCSESEIHCYNSDSTYLEFFNNPKLISFGSTREIITKENILLKDIYNSAKILNLKYACLYGSADANDENAREKEWSKLVPFTRNSNISAANYHCFRRLIKEKFNYDISALSEMEHIRWCRFHFLNHWIYGETADGKKDSKNRIHPCLIPFDDLKDIDKEKDREAVKVLEEVFG